MVYLVRQAQTDWNLLRRCNGSTETFLNGCGLAQAQRQAENLKGTNFDACFCSPQIRARQTCEIIYSGPTAYDERLREIICGEFEGAEETAEMMAELRQAAANGERGVERFDNFIERSFCFCDMIKNEYGGMDVLVVTHAANVRAIAYYFLGRPRDYDLSKTPIKSGELLCLEN